MDQRQNHGHPQEQQQPDKQQEQQPRSDLPVKQEPQESVQQFNIDYADLFSSHRLGHGRYGRVYKHTCNGTTVAVKDIAIGAKEKESLPRLLREGEIHRKLLNKNIITLHNTQLLEQNLLLVMEFAAGGSLSDVLEKYFDRLTPSVVTDWTAQIAEGMRYLHDEKIVHRDLKSSNILVLESIEDFCLTGKTLKISDFGLALDGHEVTTSMSEPGGTIYWMAPEVVKPPHHFSKQSDVWSFGVVVWNMLTGEKPYEDLATNFEFADGGHRILPFYAGLLKRCWTEEHDERPTFENILGDILQWQGKLAREFSDVAVSYEKCEASSSTPVPTHVQQPQQQRASSSPLSRQQQQQQRCFFFGTDSTKFYLPFHHLLDVALTKDGRSLLCAGAEDGLIELCCSSKRGLSHWRPPKHIISQDDCSSSKREPSLWPRPRRGTSQDDCMLAVAALSDGRAAVSLRYAHLVVLQRQKDKSCSSSSADGQTAATATGYDAWTENLRFGDQLPWAPWWLSVHGDVLAACEWQGKRLQVLSLSSGRRLSDTDPQREYEIEGLAVAAGAVITAGRDMVKQGGGGRLEYVLDACRLDADGGNYERLWRHELNIPIYDYRETLQVICADSSGGCLYAAVGGHDILVIAVSLADGSELRRVAPSFYFAERSWRYLPMRLSLCDDEAAADEQLSSSSSSRVVLLAVLWYHPKTRDQRNVTLHRSTSYI